MTDRGPVRRWSALRPASVWLAVAVLVVGSIGSVLLYRGLVSAEQASLERYVGRLASYIEADMLRDLREQVNTQYRMATRLALTGIDDDPSWPVNAGLFLEHYSYYRSLAILDDGLKIHSWQANGPAGLVTGAEYPVDASYRRPLRAAAESGEMVVTRPYYLPDRRPGVTLMTPIGSGAEHRGFLAAVLVIPDSVEAMIPVLFREDMLLRVHAHGRDVYPFPPAGDPAGIDWDDGFEVDLDADGSGFRFDFALSDASRAQLTTKLPIVVLVSGLVVALLMSAVVLLGINALGQARVLRASNLRLEDEINEREHAERELELLVSHDSLTGLPNRAGSSDFLERLIRRPDSGDSQVALLFLDLDQFKDINDSLGHQLGDQLLCEIPRRLAGVLRDRDFVGRHGGDEFLIAVVRDSREQVEQLAGNILRAMDGGFAVEDHRLFISASIGIAYFPESGRTVSELIQNADTALFKAKNAGRNEFAVFTREMFAQAQHRLNLSRDIRHAIEDGEFRLVYQPIVDVRTLSLCGVETLMRWQHRKGYMVPPQEFIRVAEETGIIGRLGEFALDRALSDLSAWKRLTDTPPWLAVNISGAQVHEAGFAEQISVLLHQYRVEPSLLHLEITEEVLIENLLRNRRMLQKLDEIGIRIVVDDFGIGYSSLAYLKNFPISVVKIDRSFIRDLSTDPEDQAITRTICSLSADLGMQTVAEGVEGPDQLELLRRFRCSFAQGFLFSRPVDAADVARMIESE
ncbi:MAG: putative bifunctional diguanylate cyclase/phosphodiesterase, partial [Wenzhouxiangella sp.]